MSITVRVKVIREDGYWIGLPVDVPGSFAGKTLDEMMDEARAALPLLADCESDELAVEYVYDIGTEAARALDRFTELAGRVKDVTAAYDDAAKSAARALTAEGITERDGARLMGLSKQRVHQLKHAR